MFPAVRAILSKRVKDIIQQGAGLFAEQLRQLLDLGRWTAERVPYGPDAVEESAGVGDEKGVLGLVETEWEWRWYSRLVADFKNLFRNGRSSSLENDIRAKKGSLRGLLQRINTNIDQTLNLMICVSEKSKSVYLHAESQPPSAVAQGIGMSLLSRLVEHWTVSDGLDSMVTVGPRCDVSPTISSHVVRVNGGLQDGLFRYSPPSKASFVEQEMGERPADCPDDFLCRSSPSFDHIFVVPDHFPDLAAALRFAPSTPLTKIVLRQSCSVPVQVPGGLVVDKSIYLIGWRDFEPNERCTVDLREQSNSKSSSEQQSFVGATRRSEQSLLEFRGDGLFSVVENVEFLWGGDPLTKLGRAARRMGVAVVGERSYTACAGSQATKGADLPFVRAGGPYFDSCSFRGVPVMVTSSCSATAPKTALETTVCVDPRPHFIACDFIGAEGTALENTAPKPPGSAGRVVVAGLSVEAGRVSARLHGCSFQNLRVGLACIAAAGYNSAGRGGGEREELQQEQQVGSPPPGRSSSTLVSGSSTFENCRHAVRLVGKRAAVIFEGVRFVGNRTDVVGPDCSEDLPLGFFKNCHREDGGGGTVAGVNSPDASHEAGGLVRPLVTKPADLFGGIGAGRIRCEM